MTIPVDSAFWAHGRFSPYKWTRFNVQEASVDADTVVDVFGDGIAVWSRPGGSFGRSVEEARDFMSLIGAAYTLRSGTPLDFIFTGWVEATRANFDATIVGFTVPRGERPHRPTVLAGEERGSREPGVQPAS